MLPEPGPPFRVGERVAFAPGVIGPTRMWLDWEEAVIVDLDDDAETFGFRHVSEPDDARHAQDQENIVRVTPNYRAWRTAWEASYVRTGDEQAADADASELWIKVLAEHPIHGKQLDLERERRRK